MLNFSEIVRGLTDTIILARLKAGDSYGYRINKEIRRLTQGAFEFKEATLYTAFRRLEQEDMIASYWGDESTGTRRRYYRITDKGRALCAENLRDLGIYRGQIDDMLGLKEDAR